MPRRFAAANGLATISDLAAWSRAHPGELRAALGYEFVEREDGLPGLRRAYGLAPGSVQPMQQAIKYRAAADGDADVIDVYTTDGRLITYDLVVLDDDRGFFPPYQAAPLMRGETVRAHPEAAAALALLAGALDEEAMRRLNLRLQEGKEAEAVVAADALRELGLVGRRRAGRRRDGGATAGGAPAPAGGLSSPTPGAAAPCSAGAPSSTSGSPAAALALGVLVAVPLGLALERRRRAAEAVIRAVALTQTVPSLALLAFMIPLLGVGPVPALVALWIYSLFPILRNTYTGVRDADPEAVAAAGALGMTPAQVLGQIRLPLAAPVIMAGVRTAAVLTVGTATLAAFIGAGGLGEPIITGLQLADSRLILSGAVPAALLALAVDLAPRRGRAARPAGRALVPLRRPEDVPGADGGDVLPAEGAHELDDRPAGERRVVAVVAVVEDQARGPPGELGEERARRLLGAHAEGEVVEAEGVGAPREEVQLGVVGEGEDRLARRHLALDQGQGGGVVDDVAGVDPQAAAWKGRAGRRGDPDAGQHLLELPAVALAGVEDERHRGQRRRAGRGEGPATGAIRGRRSRPARRGWRARCRPDSCCSGSAPPPPRRRPPRPPALQVGRGSRGGNRGAPPPPTPTPGGAGPSSRDR